TRHGVRGAEGGHRRGAPARGPQREADRKDTRGMKKPNAARPPLSGRKVLVGVCGGIDAYKACELVRRLTKAGAEVRVVMTRAAREFVAPLTFRTLSRAPVVSELFDSPPEFDPVHISLA